jgi:hypothetical protein
MGTAGLLHAFMPQWARLALRFARRRCSAHRAQGDDRTVRGPHRPAAYTGSVCGGYLTSRFLLQAEYRKFVVLTSRDDNEEIDEWTMGFIYFF